ncbi:metal-dependent hydrolase [Halobiforma lacisalsi AJ5]|uniref:Metal-dependent hydrolase n=1 Tax=Natronobacterium lacisalsi AJ5 TaxID=358396 RepID=M0LE07_NATLA|nr:metal-dependent hydrolase [Halobiforma lacisalsi]APW96408.1 metal-dependent hydrolase [Halobiforma lacisalsi AJ5]EMA31821.1 membrane-bound metal-dependent hydrolase [Halobiforma lacisalsi AJ5]
MWPWGHLAVAYLLYAGYARRRLDSPPLAVPALAVALGSQFPDLIDKPLAWSIGVLPGGRTLTHSLLVAAVLLPPVVRLAARLQRRGVGVAFAVGYLSHLAADVPPAVLTGEFAGARFLLWPLLEAPPEDPVGGLLDAVLHYYEMGIYETVQFVLLAAAIFVWYRDGTPGLEYPRRLLAGASERWRAERPR